MQVNNNQNVSCQKEYAHKNVSNKPNSLSQLISHQQKFISLVARYNQYQNNQQQTSSHFNIYNNFIIKAKKKQEQWLQHQIIQQKIGRRSIYDKQERHFNCGCGKSYLSNPALYTHIRQKHEGKIPANTTCYNQEIRNKGRPRKQKDLQSIHSIQIQQNLKQFPKVLVNQINKYNLLIFKEYDEKIAGSLLAQEFMQYPKFINQIQYIKKHNIEKLSIQMSVDQVMAIYLFNMAELINLKLFGITEQLFVDFRECINLHYKKMHESYQRISKIYCREPDLKQNDKILEYCEKSCPQLIPLISQYFILQYLPKRKKKFMDIKLIKIIILDFCTWLYFNKLTHLKLSNYSPQTLPNIDIDQMRFS